MRSMDGFCDAIDALCSYRYVWPDIIAPEIQASLSHFDQLCLSRLADIVRFSLPDEEKEKRLRQFFAMRWAVAANTSLDYTLNPALPSNQLFLNLAKHIAKPEEAVCSILMPSVEKIIGSDSPQNIKYASEDAQDEFHLHHFLVNTDGNALLSLTDIFSYAICDTDFLFPSYLQSDEAEKNLQFDISADDGNRIKQVSTETAQLWDSLAINHRIRYQEKPSIGYALQMLQKALLKSSKLQKGSDAVANIHECQQPIQIFYHLWQTLPEEMKNQIDQRHAINSTFVLKDLLFCLFAHTPGIVLRDADYLQMKPMVACTHQIGLQLQMILNEHLELKNIPMPGASCVEENVYSADRLKTQYQHHLDALKNPRVLLGEKNAHVVRNQQIFSVLTQFSLDFDKTEACFASLSIDSMSDFLSCLNMVPKEQWELFLETIDETNDYEFFSFLALLKALPTQEWNRFFAIIFDSNLGDLIDTQSIAVILSELPESQHPHFLRAIDRFINFVLNDAEDIINLLVFTEIQNWSVVVNYFERKITALLSEPQEMVLLFFGISCNAWLTLSVLFQFPFRRCLLHYKFDVIYDFCETDQERENLVTVLLHDRDWIAQNPLLLIKILHCVQTISWPEVFNLFTAAHYQQMFNKETNLLQFLNRFESDDLRLIAIRHLREHLSSITIQPEILLTLLEIFPECQTPLIVIFKKQLPTIFAYYLNYFSIFSQHEPGISPLSLKKNFLFLSKQSLPLLLSLKTLAEQCVSFRKYHDDYADITPDPLFRLYRQLRHCERKMSLQEMSREEASIEKLKLLAEFVRMSKTMRRTRAPFYRELIAFYGENFFDDMLRHCESLLLVQGVGFFSRSQSSIRMRRGSITEEENTQTVRQRSSSVPARTVQPFFCIRGSQMRLNSRAAPRP